MNVKEEWANMVYDHAMAGLGEVGYDKVNQSVLKNMSTEVGKTLKKAHQLPVLTKELSKFPIVRNEAGKVSAYMTYQTLPKELKTAIKFVSYFRQRAQLYPDGSKAVEWGMFTPIFMRAHKEYNDVMYEEWSFHEDDMPELGLGIMLWETIHDFREFTPGLDDKLEQLREDMFAMYPNKNILCLKDLKNHNWKLPEGYTAPKQLLMMKAQFWVACPWGTNRRTKFQILNSVDLDNMPEPLGDEPTDVEAVIAYPSNRLSLKTDPNIIVSGRRRI